MLLNTPKNSNLEPISIENVANDQSQSNNTNTPANKLNRLLNCCNNNTESACCNKGLNLSTILFFVLIFLILFNNN